MNASLLFRKIFRTTLLLTITVAIPTAWGCSGSGSSNDTVRDAGGIDSAPRGDDAGIDFVACGAQHVAPSADGDAVIHCDKPFASAPRVHLPADDTTTTTTTTAGVATMYGTFDVSETSFVLRDGSRLALMDDHGAPLSFRDGSAAVSIPAALRMPSNRSMYLVYRITGTLGQTTAATVPVSGVHVLSGSPIVMLPGNVLDGAMLGVWEGTTTARASDGSFTTQEVPIRVRFSNLAPAKNLDAWNTEASLADGTTFKISGEIENLDRAVKASDGKCYAALSSLGDANPFHGASSGAVDMHRLGGMHAPGDHDLVFTLPLATTDWSETAMSKLGPFAPIDWIATKGWSALHLKPHGIPKGNVITLHHVDPTAPTDGC